MSPSAPVLEMAGVVRSFPAAGGAVEVLRGVDLRVEAGEFVMITGPSGSGKSTLLHLAALLDSPSSGSVRLEGRDFTAASESARCEARKRGIGIVFQSFCLLPYRSAFENVRFRFRYLEAAACAAPGPIDRLLAEMGLAGVRDRPARLLSAGEMQRVAVARAVAHEPRLLLADEPTGNLDRAAAESVMECFHRLHGRGLTILMVTHNDRLLEFATRHLACREGRLAAAAGNG